MKRIATPKTPSGEVYVYGQRQVWSSANFGRSFHELEFLAYDGSKGTLPELVKQVETSADGDLAVLTESNRLFMGKSGLSYAWEVVSPISSNATFARIQYGVQGTLWALHSADGSIVQRDEVFVGVVPPPSQLQQFGDTCPCLSIHTSSDDVIWIDKSENATVEVVLEHTLNSEENQLAVVSPVPSLINLELDTHAQINYNLSLASRHATMTFTGR